MTNQQPEDWGNNPQSLSLKQKLATILSKPQTQIISLVTVSGILAGGYGITRYLINSVIPSRIETELEKILSREVNFGKVSHSLFNEIIIEDIEIPPLPSDPSFLSIESAKISLDLWSLLWQRQLPINIIANDITGYGQLDTLLPPEDERKPFPSSLKLPSLPVETKINLTLRNSKIAISPNAITEAVEIDSRGRLTLLYDNENQPLTYNLENRIGFSRINLQGETLLADTASDNKIEIRYLNLPEVARLIPMLPLDLQEGILNGNLKITTPSLSTLNINNVEGKVNLQDVKGKVDIAKLDSFESWEVLDRFNLKEKIQKTPLLNQNFQANVFLDIKEESLNVEYASVKIGEIDASVRGEISQLGGYNLQGNLNPVNLNKVLSSLGVKSPVSIDGLLTANILVTGNLDNPDMEGKVKVDKTFVDKLNLGNIDSQFKGNLDKLTIQQVTVKPATGGKITAGGVINTNFNQNPLEGKPVELTKIPFNLQFTADLPQDVWSNYDILSGRRSSIEPLSLTIRQILAKGEIKGNLNNPQGEISFSLPSISALEEEFATEGKLVIDKNRVNIIDTQLVNQGNQNRILVNGNGNIKEKTYAVNLSSNEINLTPFLSPLCQIFSFCDESFLNVNLPTLAQNLDVNISGDLAEISLNNIDAKGKVNLLIDNQRGNPLLSTSSSINETGNINLDFNLAKSDLNINTQVKQISLNNILPSLPNLANILNSQITLSANTQDLFTPSPDNNFDNNSNHNFPVSLIVTANSKLQLEEGLVNTIARIDEETTTLTADVSQISINQFITSLPLDINSSQVNLSAKTRELSQLANQSLDSINYETLTSLPSLNLTADIRGRFAGGDFNSQTQVKNSQVSLQGFADGILLSQLLPNTNINNSNVTAENIKANVSLTSSVSDLVTFTLNYLDNQTFSSLPSLNLSTDIKGRLAQGNFNSEILVRNNQLSLEGVANGISFSQLFPKSNLKVNNLNGSLSLASSVSDLFSFATNYVDNQSLSPIPSLNLKIDGNGNLAQGKVLVSTRVNNNQWQSRINTRNVNFETLNQQLSLISQSSNINLANLDNINGEINLSGSLLPVLANNASLAINIDSANFDTGKNTLKGKGNFYLVNLFSSPDINNLQLQVTANSNLNIIPINQLLASASSEDKEGFRFLPTSIDLDGRVNFQGVVKGNQLLSNPLAENNLDIQGDLILSNFNVNQLGFESELKGKLTANSSLINLDLRGKEDVIAISLPRGNVNLTPINLTTPFFPSHIEIKQGRDSGFSLLGKRIDNQFNLVFSDFALETLALQPAVNYGVKGKLKGVLSSDITVNLSDFSATGNVSLDSFGLGNIIANNFSTNFNFANSIAQLENARLSFANTNYDLEGKFNFATQVVEGRMALEGRVEDIFATLQISDVDTLTALLTHWQTGDVFASADNIPPASVGDDKDSIKAQVNLLYIIDQQIRSMARDLQSGKIPNDLDIRGKYQGEILLAGKITSPEVNINFQGNQWQWLPQQNFANIVDSLGLVIEETQFIPIEKIALKASWRDQNFAVQPFELSIANSQVFFAGNLSTTSQAGDFKVVDFPLDFLENFVKFPVDLDSLISLDGKLSGDIFDPQIIGNVALKNTALDGAIIDEEIKGIFAYNNHELKVSSIENQNIEINASIPYHPLVIEDKSAFITVKVDTDRVKILDIITQGKMSLNSGNISSDLSLEIASINQLINNFKPELISLGGEVNFDNAVVNAVGVNNTINLTGKVNIEQENQVLNIEELKGIIDNADITIVGNLPLFNPINNNENPLSIKISNQKIAIENLYTGKIQGDITVNGTAFTPEIGGYVSLNNGNFVLPDRENLPSTSNGNNNSLGIGNKWLGDTSASNKGIFQPQLTDFTLKIADGQLAEWNLYRFLFGGEVTVNGGLYNWQNLRADGAINLRRGQIYLGGANPLAVLGSNTGFGQTTFFLSRTNENSITFRPDGNILNPQIDIEVQADIVDYSRQLPTNNRNEVLDPIVRGGRGENIQVVLRIDGGLAQLLPVLSGGIDDYCRIKTTTPIAEEIKLSSSQLNEVAQCVNLAALNQKGTNLNLLNSPLVSLRSIPNRSEGELINLIVGGQLLNLATQLQDLSGQDLFENGLVQFILVPLTNNISFGINEKVSTWGKPLGMKDLRIFPLVEGVYEVKEDSNVTVSYDYIYGEYKVRYQMRF
ncbi:translocation/assembly module TamB domain-containing protein [Geminocystis herdmanii]|uniref:translocation/assembly module TamB domain-containing protein n=1 Tax=Geminocystis herdmanii TaxID=669359 RepID=UPI00034A39C5|nr:translocation/assembly module TamB domain-containing protein [Geminocystis herdmanii]